MEDSLERIACGVRSVSSAIAASGSDDTGEVDWGVEVDDEFFLAADALRALAG